ncbi:MAG: hypothetical protein Kow0013_29600 [Pararhodobacter sp.]
MIYETAREWTESRHKRVLLFGMSGLGKTRSSAILREGGWFHYSVDYRIGTRYLGEAIADNFKREAMKVPLLRELLMSDSVRITSNITFDNLTPLSTWLGKPGDPALGGLPFDEYRKRQALHREAEIAALLDSPHFIERAKDIYGYDNFVCDTSGSICEVVNPDYPVDPVLSVLSRHLLLVWIEGSEDHTAALIKRFDRAPKPMYYRPEFLLDAWNTYLQETGRMPGAVDPDAFVRWTYARALAHRQPRYAAIAAKWGLKVTADEISQVQTPEDFIALIADALDRRASAAA